METNYILTYDSSKILKLRMKHGIAAYGVYVALMGMMEKTGELKRDYQSLSFELDVDQDLLKSVVEDFDLFVVESDVFYSQELRDYLTKKEHLSQIRSAAVRKRWEKKQDTNVLKQDTNVLKQDTNVLKQDTNVLKQDTNVLKQDTNVLKQDTNVLKQDTNVLNGMFDEKESSPHTPYKENITLLKQRSENKFSDSSSVCARKSPKQPTLVHRCRLVFEDYYKTLYGASYYWEAKDAKAMGALIKQISFSRRGRDNPLPVDDDSLVIAVKEFLEAINKDWIMKNFSVTKIRQQYNEIIAEIKNRRRCPPNDRYALRKQTDVPQHNPNEYDQGFK